MTNQVNAASAITFTADNFAAHLKSLTGPALVELYNEMVGTAIDLGLNQHTTTKRFGDRGAGVIRCERLHKDIRQKLDETKQPGDDELARANQTTAAVVATETAATAANQDQASAGSNTEGADDMARKAKGKKGGARAKSTNGTSIREMTEEYNSIVKGLSAAVKKENPWAKHHTSNFESKDKAKKQLARLKKIA